MSLNKKYTWARFLKDHPEHKEKKTKRTSKEGQKAFDAAFKQHAKEYLKDRLAKIEKEQKTVEANRSEFTKSLKEAKQELKKIALRKRISAAGPHLARLERNHDRTKAQQKNI